MPSPSASRTWARPAGSDRWHDRRRLGDLCAARWRLTYRADSLRRGSARAHTRQREPAGAIFLLRHRKSGDRRARLNDRPTSSPGLHRPGLDAARAGSTGARAPEEHDMTADVVDQTTGAGEPLAAHEISAMRERIDEIDQAIIDLWLERARLSQSVGN